jgi:mannose-6-phosphate isomerase-like protein (cupin superfamily)
MRVVNLAEAFARFTDRWSPKIVGELNDCHVKLAKLEGEFVWHAHAAEDELFLVVAGQLRMCFRDHEVVINPGEFVIVPRGVDHLPIAAAETHVLLLEPKSTINTGDAGGPRTVTDLARL